MDEVQSTLRCNLDGLSKTQNSGLEHVTIVLLENHCLTWMNACILVALCFGNAFFFLGNLKCSDC